MNYYDWRFTHDSETDILAVKCRAHGGPSECSVHGPMLKAQLNDQDGLDCNEVDDEAYLAAVKNGDMWTCRKMVRECAEKAFKDSIIRDSEGHLVEMFHGSSRKWNVFNESEGAFGRGVYFTSAFPEAADYVREKLDDPEMPEDVAEDYITSAYIGVTDQNDISNSKYGYADFEWGKDVGYEDGINIQAVVKRNRIKSSDPVTYDDDGKIIPLSKRFDMTNPDVRY